MKVEKIIKKTLLDLLGQAQVAGNPDSKVFKDSVEAYDKAKEFVENLEEKEL